MKRKILSMALTLAMAACMLGGCGGNASKMSSVEETKSMQVSDAGTTSASGKVSSSKTTSGEKEVLKFYHGYFHDKATWAPAAVMRDIYQKFADIHADGPVTFEPIALDGGSEQVVQIVTNEIAGGTFPDMVDFAGSALPLGAISQNLVYDMKDYIDSEGLKNKVGLNYTTNQIDGKIYTVHDQLFTMGLWYNEDAYKKAGASLPDTWKNYEDMQSAMETLRKNGGKGTYAYSAGQGSIRLFNTYMGLLNKDYASSALTGDIVNSDEFAKVFKTVATMDQANGSANTSDNVGDFQSDFQTGKCLTWLNGVWAAGALTDVKFKAAPAVYPGNVSIANAGGGLTISAGLSEAQRALALEFVKYMTSDEVQEKIFLEVQANPCNSDLDLNALAKDNKSVEALAKACELANSAATIVSTTDSVWGGDVQSAIINKLIECSVEGADIDAKLAELKAELIALIG